MLVGCLFSRFEMRTTFKLFLESIYVTCKDSPSSFFSSDIHMHGKKMVSSSLSVCLLGRELIVTLDKEQKGHLKLSYQIRGNKKPDEV